MNHATQMEMEKLPAGLNTAEIREALGMLSLLNERHLTRSEFEDRMRGLREHLSYESEMADRHQQQNPCRLT